MLRQNQHTELEAHKYPTLTPLLTALCLDMCLGAADDNPVVVTVGKLLAEAAAGIRLAGVGAAQGSHLAWVAVVVEALVEIRYSCHPAVVVAGENHPA
jgi:hypothetical protein